MIEIKYNFFKILNLMIGAAIGIEEWDSMEGLQYGNTEGGQLAVVIN